MSIHDRWGGKRTGDGSRWEVRWRTSSGRQVKRRFATKTAAERWEAQVTIGHMRDIQTRTVGDIAPEWAESKRSLKASARRDLDLAWRLYVAPRWEYVPLASITAAAVASWVGEMAAHSPANARRALGALSGICRFAVMSGIISANPCAGVKRPRPPRADVTPLSPTEVERIAGEMHPHELAVWVLATTGVRFGEMAALRVMDLDAKRRRLSVRAALTQVGGRVVRDVPKSGRAREVVAPGWLVERLVQATGGGAREAPLLPTPQGYHWRLSSWHRLWGPARRRAGLPECRVHDLRHTAAVQMIEAGVPLRTVQAQLGHSSLAMTTDLYGRWARDGLDEVGDVWSAPKAPFGG